MVVNLRGTAWDFSDERRKPDPNDSNGTDLEGHYNLDPRVLSPTMVHDPDNLDQRVLDQMRASTNADSQSALEDEQDEQEVQRVTSELEALLDDDQVKKIKFGDKLISVGWGRGSKNEARMETGSTEQRYVEIGFRDDRTTKPGFWKGPFGKGDEIDAGFSYYDTLGHCREPMGNPGDPVGLYTGVTPEELAQWIVAESGGKWERAE